MYEIEVTDQFRIWFASLKDKRAKARIAIRLERIAEGNLGDWKRVGDKVGEIRLHFGPGYRIYFTRKGTKIIILLCGGDKSGQTADIQWAVEAAGKVQ